MYPITSLVWPSVSLSLYAGIFPLPSLVDVMNWASDAFTISGALNESTLKFFAVGVVASPSAPWHIAHFALYVSAPGACAKALPAKEMARKMKAAFLNFMFIIQLRGPFNGRYITD